MHRRTISVSELPIKQGEVFVIAAVAVLQSPSRVWFFATSWTVARQASLSFTIPRVCSNSCPLSQWCHPTISSSVIPFSSLPLSFPGSRSFPMSRLFASGGQRIGASALASVFPINIQGWFPLGLISLISLLSKGLPRGFSSTTVQHYPFFSTQSCLWCVTLQFVPLTNSQSPMSTKIADTPQWTFYWPTSNSQSVPWGS